MRYPLSREGDLEVLGGTAKEVRRCPRLGCDIALEV